MRTFFTRNNAFNAVLFGSVFLLAFVRTIIFKEDMMEIASVLGVLTFIFSLINGIVNIFDSIIKFENDQLDNECYGVITEDEDCEFPYEQLSRFYDRYFSKKMKLHDLCRCLVKDSVDEGNISLIISGYVIRKKRKIHIKIRRVFLYFYYFIVMIILLYLFLASDLSPYLSGYNLGEWTLWSFVIILFEILLKDSMVWTITISQIDKIEKEKNEAIKKYLNKEISTEETINGQT